MPYWSFVYRAAFSVAHGWKTRSLVRSRLFAVAKERSLSPCFSLFAAASFFSFLLLNKRYLIFRLSNIIVLALMSRTSHNCEGGKKEKGNGVKRIIDIRLLARQYIARWMETRLIVTYNKLINGRIFLSPSLSPPSLPLSSLFFFLLLSFFISFLSDQFISLIFLRLFGLTQL